MTNTNTSLIDTLSNSQLVAVYNHHTDKPVKRFETTSKGRTRLIDLLAMVDVSIEDAVAATFGQTEPVVAPVEISAASLAALEAEIDAAEQREKAAAAEPYKGNPAAEGLAAVKADDAERDAIAAEKAERKPRQNRRDAVIHARVAKAAKVADPIAAEVDAANARIEAKAARKAAKAALADGLANAAKVDAAIIKGAKGKILAMILASKDGVTEREVAAALGWPKAGGTISRALKLATFTVVKTKGEDGRVRYCAA